MPQKSWNKEKGISLPRKSRISNASSLYREFRQAVDAGEQPSRNIAINPNTADPDDNRPGRRAKRRPGSGPDHREAGLKVGEAL